MKLFCDIVITSNVYEIKKNKLNAFFMNLTVIMLTRWIYFLDLSFLRRLLDKMRQSIYPDTEKAIRIDSVNDIRVFGDQSDY